MGLTRQLEEQLSVPQVAERLGVSAKTVWRWIARGQIKPVRKLSHKITRVPASAVNAFLESRTVTS